jgi:hypothetical protein
MEVAATMEQQHPGAKQTKENQRKKLQRQKKRLLLKQRGSN